MGLLKGIPRPRRGPRFRGRRRLCGLDRRGWRQGRQHTCQGFPQASDHAAPQDTAGAYRRHSQSGDLCQVEGDLVQHLSRGLVAWHHRVSGLCLRADGRIEKPGHQAFHASGHPRYPRPLEHFRDVLEDAQALSRAEFRFPRAQRLRLCRGQYHGRGPGRVYWSAYDGERPGRAQRQRFRSCRRCRAQRHDARQDAHRREQAHACVQICGEHLRHTHP